MAKNLLEMTPDDGVFADEGFKALIEDHLSILSHKNNILTMKEVSPVDANRFEYDFFGLCRFLSIPYQHQWIAMRVNGLKSPQEYRNHMLQIKVPNVEIVESLRSYYMQVVRKAAG